MTNAKHYPGPWRAAAGPSSIVGWPVVAQSGRLICNVGFIGKTDDVTDPEYISYKEQCGANAKLIAAAPEMAERIEELERNAKFDAKLMAGYHQLCVEHGFAPSSAELLAACERMK